MNFNTTKEIILKFSNYLVANGISPLSLKFYRCDINHFLINVILLSDITPEFINLYINNSIKNSSIKTTNRRLSTIRKFSQFLIDRGLSSFDFSKDIRNVFSADTKAKYISEKIASFDSFLIDQKISKNTRRNYLSDINRFILWQKKTDGGVKEYLNQFYLNNNRASHDRMISALKKYYEFKKESFPLSKLQFPKFSPYGYLQENIIKKLESKPTLQSLIYNIFYTRPKWYKRYHTYPIASYVHFAILVIFSALSGYLIYDRVFKGALAYPSTPVTPNRYLSFQGRLTNNLGTPITTARDLTFKLYTVSSGGTAVWDSTTCSITPDSDGIFSTLLGSSCGGAIASSVFSENAGIWLGVKVAADAEATPRIQIATVAYALNSETLQGFPLGTGVSTVPYIDSAGKLAIAAASPTIESTSGIFGITGQAMTISTADTTNGSIGINPDGTGTLNLTFEGIAAGGGVNGFINAVNANITGGAIYGATVASAATGYNFVDFQSGVSPSSKFSVDSTGTITSSGDITIGGGNINTGNIALVIGDATTDSIQLQTDGTGNAEIVLPDDSVGPNEVFTTGQTDEYCLSYEATGTTWEWKDCAGGTTLWDTIGNPAGNGAIAFGSTLQTLDWTDSVADGTYFGLNFDNNDSTAGNDYFVEINNAVSTNTGGVDLNTEALLRLQQLDTTTSGTTLVDNFIYIDVAGLSGATDGIEITNSAGNLANGINIVDTAGGTLDKGIVLSGTFTTAGIDTGNSIITNIGDAGTDFSSTGGLTLAGYFQTNASVDFLLQGSEQFFSEASNMADVTTSANYFSIYGNDTASGGDNEQTLLDLVQENNSVDVVEGVDALLTLTNDDPDDVVNDAIRFNAGNTNSPDFEDGIDFSAANLNREIVFENGEALHGQTADTFTFEDDDGTDYATLSATALTLTGNLAVNGDNVTSDSNLTINAAGYIRVGDTGTPGLATGDDDLYVEGDLEVDGSIYDASGNVVGGYWVLNTGKLYPTTLTNLVGIGTVSPISRLSVVNNPGAGNYTGTAAFLVDQYENQDILTASASGTTKMTLTSDGTLKLYNAASTISNTSGDITLDSASNIIGFSGDTATNIGILQVAGATAATYSRFGSDTTGHGGAISAGSDLLVSGDLELNGNLYLDSGTIANAAGTAAILLSSSVTDTANTLSSSNWFIENTANVGQAALMVNQTKSGDLLTASQSGVTKFTVGQETSTSDLAKLTSNIITTGNVLSATASAITSGNMIKLGEAGPQNFTGNGILMDFDQTGGGNFTGNFLNLKNNDVSQFIIDSAGKLYDQFVTAGIRIGDTTSAALSGFGASSIVGALNELKNSNKTITHNDYWSWAQHYQSKAEGTANDGTNTPLDGLFFDTFLDSTKADTVTSTSSGIIQVSDPFAPVKPAAPYRVGLMGGATMNSSQTDNDGQTYLSSNVVYDIDYYDRTKDSTPAVLIELGIDPNWYNGVTLSVATTSATLSQSDTVPDVNPNLNTTYNGSLIKATGTYPSNANAKPIYITIKTPTTFDWTNYNGHAATAVTITPGTAQALGSSGVSITFSNVLYNVGDVFRIASWYVEPEGANRGAKQQFPERANIIANSGGVDIIDVDTQKLWISFAQSTNYMIGVSTNNDPNAVKMLNSKLYIAENGSAATGLYAIDFGNDAAKRTNATNTSLSDRPIAQRNFTTTYNGLNTGQVLINVTAQDVDAAVIPNDTTKEITVSGWGFVAGTTNPLTENVYLPYTFNSPPIIESVTIGYISGANPVSLSDCTSNAYNSNTSIYAVTNSSFTYSMRDSAGTPVAATRYCYSWTATGKVSPKQVVAVATGVSGTDGGVTVINETSGDPSRHYFVGSQDATVLWSDKVAFADDGTLYITHNAGTTLSAVCTYYGILGVPSETIWAQYYNGCYYVNSATGNWSNPGLVIKGASVNSDIKSLQVTSGTSTVSPGSNTLYIGTSGGVSVIQENQGRGTWVDSAVEGSGSIKYYTYQYISEEMVGDIRNMMPFAGTGALSADTTVPSPDTDVTIRTNTFTTKGSTTVPTRTAGVRGKALSFDGGDYLVTGTTGTAADDADFDITTGTTISLGAWIYPTSTAANQMIQSKWSNGPFFLRLNNGTTIDFTIYNGGVVTITSTMPFSLNQWHHVVAVRNGANMYIYINGNLAGFGSGAGTAALSDSAAPFCIGCWSPNTTTFDQFFNGVIDEPFVTATALSELKVKQMYEVGYRAMQSHANPGLGISAADSNQQFSGTTNLVGAAIPDYNNQYLYVGTNSTSVGSLSKMQLNSDTLIKQYNGSNNTPAGGTLVLEEDITSLGVGYQLEAVGSATSGVKSMSPDNNAATYGATSARSFLSKTQTLSSATKFAYVWASRYKDSSESTSRMVVYACNEYATAALCTSNNAWVVGTSIQTDSSQSIPEEEFNFTFTNAGSYLTFKFDFLRGTTFANTYLSQYGASWASSVGGADIAERYHSNEPVYPGDILAIDTPPTDGDAGVSLARTPYDRKLIGIVTTNPGIVMDENLVDLNFNAASRNSPDRPAVALAGRVPIKVSTVNGNIEVGDPITSSSIPGVGVKATKAGTIVAKALQSFSCEETVSPLDASPSALLNQVCEGTVMALVNISWYDPDAYLTNLVNFQISRVVQGTHDVVYKIVRVTVNGTEEVVDRIGTFGQLIAGTIKTGSFEANLTKTDLISPLADSTDVTIKLGSEATPSGELAIKNMADEEVASIDSQGNATFSGTTETSNLIVNNDATISGTLYANDIESKRLQDIEELLKSVEENQTLLTEASTWSKDNSTDLANKLNSEDWTVNNLYVTNQAAITSLLVTNNFTVNTIDSLDKPLSIQSLALNPLEIMAGKIKVETNGDVTFFGNVEVVGNLTINNLVVANNTEDIAFSSAEIIEGETKSNATAGRAVLTAGTDKLRIINDKVGLQTLVYLTPLTSTKNQVLFVKAKDTGYFEAGFDQVLDQDVEFNWWIIELLESEVVNSVTEEEIIN